MILQVKNAVLGFVSEAYGYSPNQTFERKYPWCLNDTRKLPVWLRNMNDDSLFKKDGDPLPDSIIAIEINDSIIIPGPEKEIQLKKLFLKHGIDLQFVD